MEAAGTMPFLFFSPPPSSSPIQGGVARPHCLLPSKTYVFVFCSFFCVVIILT